MPGLTPTGPTPPLPGFAVIDPALNGPQISQSSDTPGILTGSLDGLTPAEVNFVNEQLNNGVNVRIIPRGPGRTADFELDGIITEYKHVSRIKNQTSDGLSASVSRTILSGRGQSGNLVIDARQQPGMTREIGERAIARAIGNDAVSGAKIQTITILSPDGSAEWKR